MLLFYFETSQREDAAAKPVSISAHKEFNMDLDDDNIDRVWPLRMLATEEPRKSNNTGVDYSLSPSASHHELTPNSNLGSARLVFASLPVTTVTIDMYSILVNQQKFFEAFTFSQLIEQSVRTTIGPMKKSISSGGSTINEGAYYDFYDALYVFDNEDGASSSVKRGRRRGNGDTSGIRKAHSIGAASKLSGGRSGITQTVAQSEKDVNVNDSDGADGAYRRSRSTGANMTRKNSRGKSLDIGLLNETDSDQLEGGQKDDQTQDEELNDDIERFHVIRTLSTEVQAVAYRFRGPINGVWITTPPLQLVPTSFTAALNSVIDEPSLSINKQAEWTLDCIREYDEKRIESLEEFLISCRTNVDIQLQSINKAEAGNKIKNEKAGYRQDYYRDRGRQPRNCRTFSSFM